MTASAKGRAANDETSAPSFGLFLNMGANLGSSQTDVFQFTLDQAKQAEALGFGELWVTEHHFIEFGLNPSALTAAAFLLGQTSRVRVGTAVVLSPLQNGVQIAEQAALLDQMSGGRFDLGIGRGGYVKDFEVLGIDTGVWDSEPVASAQTILDVWSGAHDALPHPLSKPRPPLFMGTSSKDSISFAADHGIPLQHYFGTPASARTAVEKAYRSALTADAPQPDHMHALIVIVTNAPEEARAKLRTGLTDSFIAGNHPAVPQATKRHVDEIGIPIDRAILAKQVSEFAIIGKPDQVVDELQTFMDTTGARRLSFFMEAVADQQMTHRSIELFASDVMPHLQ